MPDLLPLFGRAADSVTALLPLFAILLPLLAKMLPLLAERGNSRSPENAPRDAYRRLKWLCVPKKSVFVTALPLFCKTTLFVTRPRARGLFRSPKDRARAIVSSGYVLSKKNGNAVTSVTGGAR